MTTKAIVTGHSRGLGAAIAAELLSRGIPVLGISRRRNAELERCFSATLEQCELDLSDSASVARWISGGALHRHLSGCDRAILVNSAATLQPVGPIETLDPAAIAQAVALNLAAPLMLASAVAAGGREAMERRILHISSGAGSAALPGWSIYCATKAALDHHARAAAQDRKEFVRICSVAPGVVDTDMQAEIRAFDLERFPLRPYFESLLRDGMLASPAACARELADYLLSAHFGQTQVASIDRLRT